MLRVLVFSGRISWRMENTQVEESGQSSTKYHQLARMFALRDYYLSEKVYENKKSVVPQGAREDDKLPVLVRLLKPEYAPMKN
jgi:hypothetical protein